MQRLGGRVCEKRLCLGFISETMRYKMLILGKDIHWGCRCAVSWCDLDLSFELAIVTWSLKSLSGLYLRNRKVYKVDTW